MIAESVSESLQKASPYRAIFWAGLVSGVLDISSAFINAGVRGASPVRVLQFIASGLIGPNSFKGGLGTAALGAACHFLIAFTATVVYYAASRKLEFLTKQAVLFGLIYAVIVYVFMNFVVLPLSAIPDRPVSVGDRVLGVAILMVCIGLPISLILRWYLK